jgi:hypothetical protein
MAEIASPVDGIWRVSIGRKLREELASESRAVAAEHAPPLSVAPPQSAMMQ